MKTWSRESAYGNPETLLAGGEGEWEGALRVSKTVVKFLLGEHLDVSG
jgi:hypothetical protein